MVPASWRVDPQTLPRRQARLTPHQEAVLPSKRQHSGLEPIEASNEYIPSFGYDTT